MNWVQILTLFLALFSPQRYLVLLWLKAASCSAGGHYFLSICRAVLSRLCTAGMSDLSMLKTVATATAGNWEWTLTETLQSLRNAREVKTESSNEITVTVSCFSIFISSFHQSLKYWQCPHFESSAAHRWLCCVIWCHTLKSSSSN